jgi:hypothetical protein
VSRALNRFELFKLRRPLFGGPKGPRKFLFGETPFDQILIVRPLFWLVFIVVRPLFSGSKMGETPLAGTVHPNKLDPFCGRRGHENAAKGMEQLY